MRLGPFGCIATELFSENRNRLKTGFQGEKLLPFPQARQSTFWWFSDFSMEKWGWLYVWFDICFLQKFQYEKIFFWILINLQKVSGIPVTVTVTVSVTVTMIFEVHQSSGGLSTYIGNTKKNLERKVNVRFFTVAAYFCAIWKVGFSKRAKKDT